MGEAGEVPGEARFDGEVHLGSFGADPSAMVGNTDRRVGAPWPG